MPSTSRACRVMLLQTALALLFFLAGCNEARSGASASTYLKIPLHPVIHTFDLSARQGLRDLTGDFSARERGADTGILLLPDEKVEIFASGSAAVQPGGKQSGPEGVPTCQQAIMPEPLLPCYSVVYSVGINGRAGEVGTHIDFNPEAIGNLFLGMNTARLATNAGSFHITVLIIPSGTFTGLWAAPENGFTMQGTTMKLSAYVFAQNAFINTVQFTVADPGHTPVPICDAFKSGKDMYTCDWDVTLNGAPFSNGPITLGFTLNGNTTSAVTPAPVINPDGVRTGRVLYVDTQSNDIYAGYAATDLVRPATNQKVTGRWTVPTAHCSPGENSLAAIWVGMSNNASDNSLLAQLGTDSDCVAGSPTYFLWWEMFPAPPVYLDQPLQPGDTVTATVTFEHDRFQISIDVPKRGEHFSTTHIGKPSDTSFAECIVEAPTIIDNLATNTGHVARLTNFGRVSLVCRLNNNEPIAAGPQNILYQMQTKAGASKAATSALDPTGSTFTVQWHHG